MTGLLIATHDQACHAALEHVAAPGTDPALQAVVAAVVPLHYITLPPNGLRPDPDCIGCHGTGAVTGPDGEPEHCHCRCPWCAGCDEPVCAGPCPTVAAVVGALGLTAPSIEVAKEEGQRP